LFKGEFGGGGGGGGGGGRGGGEGGGLTGDILRKYSGNALSGTNISKSKIFFRY
jgi:hypothetical protein